MDGPFRRPKYTNCHWGVLVSETIKKTSPKKRILIALADTVHRKLIRTMLAADQYTLSWAADAQTADKRLARQSVDAIILDVSSWNKDKRVSGRKILKSAGDVPVIILPEGSDGAAAALHAFGVVHRTLPWEILDGGTLQAMIALVIQAHRDSQNLRENEQRFAKTFHASPGMFALTTPKDGRHVDVNDIWLSTMGYKRHEVIGKTASEIGVWDTFTDRAHLVGELMKHGKIREFETRFRTKTGAVINVLIAGEVLDIREQQHLLLVALDITERLKIEKTLRKSHDELELNVYERTLQLQEEIEERKNIQAALELSEQRAYDMAEAASDWFWETDDKDRFTYFSESHGKILGVNSSDIIGKTREMLAVSDEDSSKWRDHAKTIKSRNSFRDFQYDHTRRDGISQTIKISGKPFFDEKGKFIGYRGAGANITLQVAAERREAKTREQLVDAIESISDALVLFDAQGKFVMCNSRYQQILKKVSKLLVPGTSQKVLMQAVLDNDLIVTARNNPRKWLKERLSETKHLEDRKSLREELMHDGTWLRFNEYKTSEGGKLLLLTDVTGLRQAEKDMRDAKDLAEIASRAKSDFLAGMSHELRTPLNAIIGFSDVIASEIFGAIPQKRYIEYIADINQSGVHLLNLINDILDISKIESGTVKLNESTVKISKAVDISIRLVSNKVQQGGITIEKKLPGNLPALRADERRVNQILLNLVSNAVKFTPQGGKVTISATVRASGALVLSVTDTGVGISADQIENVMSEFGQIDNAVAREQEGTGLGLPLTRGLMDIHGGTLEINSKPGKGTKVMAVFPKERVVK